MPWYHPDRTPNFRFVLITMDEQRGFRGNRGRSGFRPGMKRRREQEEPAPDPYRSLLSDLLYFGDDYMPVSDH